MTPASEHKLTNPDAVQEPIRGFEISKAPGLNGIPNRPLKHLAQLVLSLLIQSFNAILLTHQLRTV